METRRLTKAESDHQTLCAFCSGFVLFFLLFAAGGAEIEVAITAPFAAALFLRMAAFERSAKRYRSEFVFNTTSMAMTLVALAAVIALS